MDTTSASIITQVAFKAAVEAINGAAIADGEAEEMARFDTVFGYYKEFLFNAVRAETEAYAPQRPAPQSVDFDKVRENLRNEGLIDDEPQQGGFKLEAANDQVAPFPTWLLQECASLGITKVWDNRSTATGKQPLFKEFVPKGGQGHGKGGEAKPFWAPDR